jgi:pyruvate dehydrogenase E2 component (dihydrolipoamide acetyltransferase)
MTKAAFAAAMGGKMSVPAGGTGIGGRIRAEDISSPGSAGQVPAIIEDTFTDVKTSKIRTIIADRMMQSLSQSAQLTMTAYANASGILALRKKLKAKQEDLKIEKITINDLVAFALARTLVNFPECNAIFANSTLRQFDHVHLAVAVDTPRGLMVPVIRFADTLSLNEIARQVKVLAKQCNEGSINPDLLSGGTITISNLGIYGIDSFTPVLNLPQVTLLGINGIAPRACEKDNGSYAIEPHVGFSLTIDHRYVDGAPAARFLKALCNAVEDIDLTLARLK